MTASVVPTLLLCLSMFFALPPDLSGTWVLDRDRSEVDAQGYMFMPYELVITQDGDDFIIVRVFEGQNGEEIRDEEKLTLDGEENTSTVGNNWTRVTTASWSDDAEALNIDTTFKFDQGDMVGHWVFSMQDDALVANYTSTSSFGDRNVTLVFTKQ